MNKTTKFLETAMLALVFAGLSTAAMAQTTSLPTSRSMPVTGNVPALCSLGANAGTGSFPLGVLIDTTTGKMRTGLSAPAQSITGSWCNSPSTISISATPLTSVNSIAVPPTGFSRTLNYTATASGWTLAASPASFTVGAAANASASQAVTSAITGPISVAISNIVPVGSDPFLVADTSYLGTITVTIAIAAASGT